MNDQLTLRAADPRDAGTIARHRYYADATPADMAAYAAWLDSRIEAGVYIGSLAERAGVVVAGAGAVLLDGGPSRGSPSGTRARVVNVFTESAWRRQGLARALVGRVLAACSDLDVQVFSVAASADGAELYRSLGFKPYPNEMILRPG
ncbi:GNAT family N-acetyltransferase [Variovorax sp. LT1R16]|uniref:GNAT family N-acetyltransferase n=1 Tax=Variovorax sp. LT1R16 TaxID=3443728 RepID=UPI003F4789BF